MTAKRQFKRVQKQFDQEKPSKTDKSMKKVCDINNIVKTYHKTGMLPPARKQAYYGDVSEVGNLTTALELSNQATELFNSLPATLRKQMDDSVLNLESFIANEQNAETCYEHGLLKRPKKKNDDTIINETQHENNNNNQNKTDSNQGNKNESNS